MEKLIELLNEFEKEKIISEGGRVDEDDTYFGRSLEGGDIVNRSFDTDAHGFFKYQIISKDFKFIERLVENDKIELHELSKKELATGWNLENNMLDEENTKESRIKFWKENLLMLLAIQDEPIEFLISILK